MLLSYFMNELIETKPLYRQFFIFNLFYVNKLNFLTFEIWFLRKLICYNSIKYRWDHLFVWTDIKKISQLVMRNY